MATKTNTKNQGHRKAHAAPEKRGVITYAEWVEIEASVEAAEKRMKANWVRPIRNSFAKVAKPIPQKPAWLDSDSEKEFRSSRALLDFIKRTRTFDAHELIAQQNQLLGDLHLESHRKLSTPKAQEVIQASAASDDFDFFIRLGKVLSQKAFEIDALVFLLVREWTERRKGISSFYRPFLFTGPRPDAPLCFFTDPALVQYCCFRLPLTPPGYSPASAFAEYQWSIPKTARRLGLKGASRKLVRKVSKKPNGQLLFE